MLSCWSGTGETREFKAAASTRAAGEVKVARPDGVAAHALDAPLGDMKRTEISQSSKCHQMCDNVGVVGLWWDGEDGDYIRRRSDRYPGATGIEPEWTLEAADDPRRIVRDPDPKSHRSAIRVIGYSPSAGFVVTVIMDSVDGAGITAWKTRGADLRSYLEGEGER